MSFHVLSVDEVRMYLHINGQTIRFFPNDIIDVLPLFFDDTFTKLASISNKEFPKSETAKKLVNQMMINLKDEYFTAFLKEYQPESVQNPYKLKKTEEKR